MSVIAVLAIIWRTAFAYHTVQRLTNNFSVICPCRLSFQTFEEIERSSHLFLPCNQYIQIAETPWLTIDDPRITRHTLHLRGCVLVLSTCWSASYWPERRSDGTAIVCALVARFQPIPANCFRFESHRFKDTCHATLQDAKRRGYSSGAAVTHINQTACKEADN